MSEAAAQHDVDADVELEDLQMEVQWLRTQMEKVYRPAIKETLPELEAENDKLQEQTETLQGRVSELEERVAALVGVPEEDASTHEKRVRDSKQVLQRRAAANDEGLSSMYWRELADSLAEHGHGELYDTQVKRVMADVAEAAGFTEATGKRDVSTADDRSDIREVSVVRCDLADVPGSGAVNNVVGGRTGQGASKNGDTDQTAVEE